jgi:hypothetical protein
MTYFFAYYSSYERTTPFGTVQEQAFTLLDRQRLTRVAEYMVNEANCDEIAKDRSLHQIASGDFPTAFFPVREKRYLYQRNETGQKHLIPDRYEFLVYRLVRHRLEAGDLFCRDSVHFRSFEDDLVDDQQWANKEVLLAQTGVALLTQPIQDHLDALKCQ